jgi:hypothetical protein
VTTATSNDNVLNGNGVFDPALAKTVPVGGLSYMAHYQGDSTYTAADGTCEQLTGTKLNSTTVTVVHNAAHAVITSALIGSSVHDKATVSGTSAGGTPTGSVDFQVWLGNTTCSGSASASQTGDVLNSSGVVDPALPETVPMGGLSYMAHYTGSSIYNGSYGSCESLVGTFNAFTPGYWKNHMANSNSKGPSYSTSCKTLSTYGGSCSTQGPWTIQYLPVSLGNFSVPDIVTASKIFQAMNCGTSMTQGAVGCLAGELLAIKLNLANGSPAFPCIQQTITNADAFLKGQTLTGWPAGVTGLNPAYTGPSGTYTLNAAQRAFALSLQTTIDNYNNAKLTC